MGNVAVFVDYENIHVNLFKYFETNGFDFEKLPQEIRAIGKEYGKIVFCKAYGDWTTRSKAIIMAFGKNLIECKHVFPKMSGEDRSDVSIVIDAMELLFTRKDIGTYVLFSGDSDFRELALKIQSRGRSIVVSAFTFATGEDLRNAADYKFLALEERLGLKRLDESSFLDASKIDWKPLIQKMMGLSHWEYIGWTKFRNTFLENCYPQINWDDIGIKDRNGNKDDFIEAAVTDGVIERYSKQIEGGSVTAIQLNQNHDLVRQFMSAS